MKKDEDNKIRRKASALFSLWRKDWNAFIRDVLGVTLDDDQKAIVTAVQMHKMVSVRSGTARGKDYVAACIAMCFLYLTPRWNKKGEMMANTKVALTAPTGRQVENIMMAEISRLYTKAKSRGFTLPGRLNSDSIRMPKNKEWFLVGFKADENNHEAWSGFHAANTMFVITEATGIKDDTYEAIEGNLQGNSRILLVFNPNTTKGYAARSQKQARWEKFCLNSLTAPNVVNKKITYVGQVDYDWVEERVNSWCEQITEEEVKESENDFEWEGKWYRPSDLFRKKVLGEFPKADDSSLIPQRWVELAQERWKLTHAPAQHDGVMGVDVAGMGRDSTVMCFRIGSYVFDLEKHDSGGKADHMRTVGTIIDHMRKRSGCTYAIDTIGEGAGVYSRAVEVCETDAGNVLSEDAIISCKYSESAKGLKDITQQFEFANMRAYLFWAVRDWLNPDNKTGACLPPDDELLEEATEIRWSFLSNGKVIIEPKEDIKERIGRSTDKFDALANTFHPTAVANVRWDERGNAQMSDEDMAEVLW